MLRSLRDGAKSGFLKFILLGFMALAVGGLVLTDVGGFFRGGISSNLVAKGRGIEISAVQFDQTVRRILARQNMSAEDAYKFGFINQILQSEIQARIMTVEARKNGILIGDDSVTKQIAKLAEPIASQGTSKRDALKQVLRAQGISEQQFIQAIRQEMANNIFTQASFTPSQTISENTASDLDRYNQETRTVTGRVFSTANIKNVAAPSEEDLQKYYEANKASYLISEKRDITIATLKKEMIAKTLTISDDDLKEAYADNIEQYKKPELRTLEQAVASDEQSAKDILASYKKTKSLKKSTIAVTGKKTNYLGKTDFAKDGLLKEMAEEVFSADQSAIIGPIQTALGWHVLKVVAIIPEHTQKFDTVKRQLKDDLLTEKLAQELEETANMLDDHLASGEPLSDIVTELGLTTETFSQINQAGINSKNKGVLADYQGDKVQILEAAFDYDQGESSAVMLLEDGRYVAVRIDSVSPQTYKSLNSVKSELRKKYINEQKEIEVKASSSEYLSNLKEQQDQHSASPAGGKKTTLKSIKRDQKPTNTLTPEGIRAIFDIPQNEPFTFKTDNGQFVGTVESISLPSKTNNIKQTQERAIEVLPQEALTLYVSSLAEKYKIKINENTLEAMYGNANNNSF